MDITVLYILIPLIIGWLADRLFGDPTFLPHPIVGFGKLISWGEKRLNKGNARKIKGAIFSVLFIVLTFITIYFALKYLNRFNHIVVQLFSALVIFFCLAGKTLIDEVKQVFIAVDCSVEKGRTQVARIVGRDTSNLSPQQIRTAALETLSENLSDGVIAPLFWYTIAGIPGMFAYKMINTLDSMIGYKSERYKDFGCWAARIDDVANYIPARLTALLMLIVSGRLSKIVFVLKYGKMHTSPNSGYPEAALAGILNCQFGGANIYHNQLVNKAYIGDNARELTSNDMKTAIDINLKTEILMIVLVSIMYICI